MTDLTPETRQDLADLVIQIDRLLNKIDIMETVLYQIAERENWMRAGGDLIWQGEENPISMARKAIRSIGDDV